jgi:hypothetical protein
MAPDDLEMPKHVLRLDSAIFDPKGETAEADRLVTPNRAASTAGCSFVFMRSLIRWSRFLSQVRRSARRRSGSGCLIANQHITT